MIASTRYSNAPAGRGIRQLAIISVIFLPLTLRAQSRTVEPLFEIFATYSRPPVPAAVADAYALSGGLRAGAGVGAAVGVMIQRIEISGFYEIASTSLGADGSRDFTRYTGGLRAEFALPEFGAQFRPLISASAFVQSLGRTSVSQRPEFLPLVEPPAVTIGFTDVSQKEALGGRLEAGVEHRGFIGTTWFVTGGVTMAGAGSGAWTNNSGRRGGIGVAPLVTVGLRTRDWAR